MKKSKFIKSTIILLIGGFITKMLGMIIKIITTRFLGTEGIGIYMLIMPTFMIFITISQLGFPIAISKLVAEQKRNNKKLVFGVLPISIVLSLVLILIILISGKWISNDLLHENRTYYAIMSIGLVLPFISISSILRGYFFGKENMVPHVVSNITEDLIRMIIIIIFLPFFISKGINYAVAFLVLVNIVSELTSILILFLFIPKNFKIKKNYFKPEKENIKEVLSISLPSTGSRIIGNIGYFFEPIILTFCLLNSGYSNDFIINEYGILNGYVMPLLLLPSFFTLAISQALIPTVSNSYSNKNYAYAKKKIKQAITLSLIIGIPITIFFELFSASSLSLVYNTNEGVTYLRFLAPICLLQYIQSPLASSLQAIGKAKEAMKGTLYGMILKTITLFIFSSIKIGIWGLIISVAVNILFVTINQLREVKKCF